MKRQNCADSEPALIPRLLNTDAQGTLVHQAFSKLHCKLIHGNIRPPGPGEVV